MATNGNDMVTPFVSNQYAEGNYNGLTKREYMAIEFTKAIIIGITAASGKEAHGWSSIAFAEDGLLQADALITVLNK